MKANCNFKWPCLMNRQSARGADRDRARCQWMMRLSSTSSLKADTQMLPVLSVRVCSGAAEVIVVGKQYMHSYCTWVAHGEMKAVYMLSGWTLLSSQAHLHLRSPSVYTVIVWSHYKTRLLHICSQSLLLPALNLLNGNLTWYCTDLWLLLKYYSFHLYKQYNHVLILG